MIILPEDHDSPFAFSPGPGGGAVRGIVSELLERSGCGAQADPDMVEQLSFAVADFIEEQGLSWREKTPHYLVMLVSRALDSLGQGETARRLLVFGTGLIRPALWEISGDGGMWTLDLRRITVASKGGALELILFRCLSAALTSVADIWDDDRGGGTLGLRGVLPVAAGLLNRSPDEPAVARLAREIHHWCVRHLADTGKDRGWQEVPRVILLDMK